MIYDKPTIAYDNLETNCKNDSLQNVIDSLQVKLEFDSNNFDIKEQNYKNIIGEYEYGIDRLKNYHSLAYEDFHRILAMKETYTRSDEMQNIKRLKSYE